jgi:ABC-type bacteriocin/lantibiotic exporter with double-glycine peptidase domain
MWAAVSSLRKPYFTPRFSTVQRNRDDNAHTLDLPGYRQARMYACGYASTLMVVRYFGIDIAAEALFRQLRTGRDGTRQNSIVRELRGLGLRAGVRYDVDFTRIGREIDRGKLIVSYLADAEHWVVVYGYGRDPDRLFVADPRPDEPCEHSWSDSGARLEGFGIICSRAPTRARAAERLPPPAPTIPTPELDRGGEPTQLVFDFFTC